MHSVYRVWLKPSPNQRKSLLETMARFHAACQDIAHYAVSNREYTQMGLQRSLYLLIKERFSLGAQATVLAIKNVTDSYRVLGTFPDFLKSNFMPYDARTCRFIDETVVSLWTLNGRRLIPYEDHIDDTLRKEINLLMELNGTVWERTGELSREVAQLIPLYSKEVELCKIDDQLILNILYNSYMISHAYQQRLRDGDVVV